MYKFEFGVIVMHNINVLYRPQVGAPDLIWSGGTLSAFHTPLPSCFQLHQLSYRLKIKAYNNFEFINYKAQYWTLNLTQ